MRLSSGTSPTTACANSSGLLNLAFGYGTSNNNGNVLSQTIVMPKKTGGTLTLTQNYGYDPAGETVTAGGSGGGVWSQGYEYDPYGNRAATKATDPDRYVRDIVFGERLHRKLGRAGTTRKPLPRKPSRAVTSQ